MCQFTSNPSTPSAFSFSRNSSRKQKQRLEKHNMSLLAHKSLRALSNFPVGYCTIDGEKLKKGVEINHTRLDSLILRHYCVKIWTGNTRIFISESLFKPFFFAYLKFTVLECSKHCCTKLFQDVGVIELMDCQFSRERNSSGVNCKIFCKNTTNKSH